MNDYGLIVQTPYRSDFNHRMLTLCLILVNPGVIIAYNFGFHLPICRL